MIIIASRRLLGYEKFLYVHCKRIIGSKNVHHTARKQSSNSGTGSVQATLSNKKNILFSTGEYARLAEGSVLASMEDTSVMAVVVKGSTNSSDSVASIAPLTVNYRQKAAAAGRIPANMLRREIGTSPQEILKSRVIDRSLRPLLLENFNTEIQLTCNLLAVDDVNDPEVLAINAASAALSLSSIPWNGPVAAVRIGMIDKNVIINPTKQELRKSSLNILVTGAAQHKVVMLEGTADQIPKTELCKAIKDGVAECQIIIKHINSLKQQFGKPKVDVPETSMVEDPLLEQNKDMIVERLKEVLSNHKLKKLERDQEIKQVKQQIFHNIYGDTTIPNHAEIMFYKTLTTVFRDYILNQNIRCDGRNCDHIRDIRCRVDLFKPLHGSAIFQRGQTQVLCTATLDSKESALKLDPVSMILNDMKVKNFFLHYDFPPYATNETGKVGFVNRREIGHGMLAENGLRPVVPKDYPFTIRLNCEVLESNGSSSMASVCAGSLALLDAGVPIEQPCAGIAMGLITRRNEGQIDDYKILTDILGMEDHFGDMDFKMSATKRGFTALQLDIKIPGIPIRILREAIEQGSEGISQILHVMHSLISSPRNEPKKNMPVVDSLDVPIHLRGQFLGIGGYNLNKILVETGVQIRPETETKFAVFAPNADAMAEAKQMIDELLKRDMDASLEFGCIYTAKIVEIRESGVMVTLYSNMKPALLPTSQLDQRRVYHPQALGLEVGQEIQVKYFGRDPATGTLRLSRKVLQEPSLNLKTLQNS